MFKTITEQEWVYNYAKSKENPLPVVLGTNGTWTGNGKPMIILIGFTMEDVLVLGDMYGVSHHPVRKMKSHDITYFAINIIEKKKVKEIINEWKDPA
ncbi:hypothetical protein [Fredinandcohnia sp. 179-A 10B2 NHS]|uniref:hypothetical protein n=1 Tax=Fredinandcohnia sp. 179-A 10B2 NHS TaxID=3235176 RepID=UPI00399FEF62